MVPKLGLKKMVKFYQVENENGKPIVQMEETEATVKGQEGCLSQLSTELPSLIIT